MTSPATIHVKFSDAATDALVHLVDHGPGTAREIADAVAPADADRPYTTIRSVLRLLADLGLATEHPGDWIWSATDAGRFAVTEARTQGNAEVRS